MRIISITNQKGGCGKTTTAVNLAASLAQNNKKVLVIDLDPQAHATLGLNIKADLSIYDVLSKLTHRKTKLQNIIKNIDVNFDIAPSSLILSTLEQELAGEIGRESRVWDTLSEFKNVYDYILIDCPPNLGILTINAIRASHSVIIPVEASRFSLEGLNQLKEIVKLVRDRLDHSVDFRVLVVNFDSRLRHSFTMLDKIKETFKDKIFDTIIHVNVRLKEAQNQGTHIFSYDKYCRGAKDYYSLSREIITIDEKHTKPAAVLHASVSHSQTPVHAQTPSAPAVPTHTAPVARKVEKETTMPDLKTKMQEMIKEHMPKMPEVVFKVAAPEAKEVYVAGEFNNWQLDDNSRMVRQNDAWVKKVSLKPGAYRYRFVLDGNWTEDPANPKKAMNPFGQEDSLVEING